MYLVYIILVAVIVLVINLYTVKKQEAIIGRIKYRLSLLNSSLKDIPIYSANSSYIQNKHTIYICTKDPKTGKEYDINTLMYVVLHEVAHLVSDSYSTTKTHNSEFHKNFNTILGKAIVMGIYDDTKPVPTAYCGIN